MKLKLVRDGKKNRTIRNVTNFAFNADSKRAIVKHGAQEREYENVDSIHAHEE